MATNRGRKAPVWNYMEKIDADSVVCLLCKGTFKYSASTSSISKHIRSKHPLNCLEYADLGGDAEAEQ